MADRIRRPQQYDALLTDLRGVFDSYKDALVFSACLGFKRKLRVPFDKTSEPIHMATFSGQYDQAVMNAIAIKETSDPFVMANTREDEKVRIFEEYACGGLSILQNVLAGKEHLRLEALLNLVMGEEKKDNILDEITQLAH
jgi:dnd system-associated protein 4